MHVFQRTKSPQFERAVFDHKHTLTPTQTQRESQRPFTFYASSFSLAHMASSSSLRADQLRMKGLQLDDVSMKKLELDMREEVLHIFELEMQILFDTDALRIKNKQKYESYRFEGDPNEVGHVVTTRCTTRDDAQDVR